MEGILHAAGEVCNLAFEHYVPLARFATSPGKVTAVFTEQMSTHFRF